MRLGRLVLKAALVCASVVGSMTVAPVAAQAAPEPAAAAPPPYPSWFQPGTAWTGDFADPHVVRVGTTYYAYASPSSGRVLPVLTSTDLQTWYVHGRWSTNGPPGRSGYSTTTDPAIPVEIRTNAALGEWGRYDNNDALVRFASWGLPHQQGPWIDRDYWAPGIIDIGGTWYAYSAVKVSPTRFCLTVATAPSPLGPFRDVSPGAPIQCQPLDVDSGGSIDPFPYRDPATGRLHLLWKASGDAGSHPSSLLSVELGSNGLPKPGAPWVKLLETDPGSPWEGDTIENPSMVTFNGTTYLFYSGNLWEPLDAAGRSVYASGYAICPAGPTAPCHRADARIPLLVSEGTMQGPGGSSAFIDAQGGLRMAYATFHLGEDIGGAVPHPRRMGIATLVQDPDRTLRVQGRPVVTSQVEATWLRYGGVNGLLGPATGPETTEPVRNGAYRHHAGGSIYWSPATGAHVVRGAIRDRWASVGWDGSFLGFPTTDEVPLRGGAFTHFQGGSIYWSPTTGAQVVRGAIRDRWASLGWENSPLGYPTTGEVPLRGGAFTHFQGGSIYWSPTTGAQTVQGAIRDAWARQGWEDGRLGYPTSDEYAVPGGRRSDFQGGSVTWTPAAGVVVAFR